MLHEFGGPEVLRYEETQLPELKPGEVLVCVHAIGINPPDWYLRDGYNVLPHRLRKYCEGYISATDKIAGIVNTKERYYDK